MAMEDAQQLGELNQLVGSSRGKDGEAEELLNHEKHEKHEKKQNIRILN